MSRKANGETRERLGQSAKRSAAVHGRRSEGELQWQADVCRVCDRAEAKIFLPARFWGRSRADLLLEQQCAALLPSCARQM